MMEGPCDEEFGDESSDDEVFRMKVPMMGGSGDEGSGDEGSGDGNFR